VTWSHARIDLDLVAGFSHSATRTSQIASTRRLRGLASAEAVLICDTSGLIAYYVTDDVNHERVSAALNSDPGPFIVSPYVLAELDYLLGMRRGTAVQLAALTELSGGAWELPTCGPADVRAACAVIQRYRDQGIGLADASLVVLAARFKTDRVLTLDHRHFRVLRTIEGAPFAVVPD
jgi:uncharacterized protein